MCDKFVLSGQAAKRPTLRKLNSINMTDLIHFESLKIKNTICPVCRDTQLPQSSIRSFSLILFDNRHHQLINPDASANLAIVKHDSLRPLKITAANKAVQFIALAARTIP
jgi:hypothetical protein